MKTIFTLFLCCAYCICNAQNLIAVEHSGVSKFYTTFDSAYNAAQNGDNIYLPGGNFTASNPIAKSLHIYGAGYNQDSSGATGITYINQLTINSGSDNGSIQGISFIAGPAIKFGTDANSKIANYSISYCFCNGLEFDIPCSLFSIKNSYINGYSECCYFSRGAFTGSLSNSTIINNIITYSIQIDVGSYIANNIFFYHDASGSYPLNLPSNSTYENNIFEDLANASGSIFNNNINASPNSNNGSSGVGNKAAPFNQTLFNNPGTANYDQNNVPYYNYDVHNNYHLKSTSSGHNAGTDGTDIGVYGGSFPWKDGSMPSNPHIISKLISGSTDSNGNITVNIKVAAQKN